MVKTGSGVLTAISDKLINDSCTAADCELAGLRISLTLSPENPLIFSLCCYCAFNVTTSQTIARITAYASVIGSQSPCAIH